MQVAAFVIPVKIIFCFSRPSFLPPRKGVQRLPSSQSPGPACSHVSLCPVPTPGCGLSPQWTSEHQAQETGPGWPRPVCAHPTSGAENLLGFLDGAIPLACATWPGWWGCGGFFGTGRGPRAQRAGMSGRTGLGWTEVRARSPSSRAGSPSLTLPLTLLFLLSAHVHIHKM